MRGAAVLVAAMSLLGACAGGAGDGAMGTERAPVDISQRAEPNGVLDAMHIAAGEADFEAYFGCFAPGAVFLGTDAGEDWTLDAFKAYARPHFEAGRGWRYTPTARRILLGPDGGTAWFRELLEHEKYGVCRGTGVLRLVDGEWRVAQYCLHFPVPNGVAEEVIGVIRR